MGLILSEDISLGGGNGGGAGGAGGAWLSVPGVSSIGSSLKIDGIHQSLSLIHISEPTRPY